MNLGRTTTLIYTLVLEHNKGKMLKMKSVGTQEIQARTAVLIRVPVCHIVNENWLCKNYTANSSKKLPEYEAQGDTQHC